MSGISTHVLDTEYGRPAAGVPVVLMEWRAGEWNLLSEHVTDANGRIARLLPEGHPLQCGLYRLTFRTEGPFYPEIVISFHISDAASNYHVPLLMSPYGYTTYRGS